MATKEGIILGDSTLIFSLLYRKNQEKDVFSKNKIIGCEKEHFTYISDNSCLIK